jgi:hypothetical protein
MNAKTYNLFKKLVVDACDKHVEAGRKIISGKFKNGHGGCYPISCARGEDDTKDYFEAMNDKLGAQVPDKEYWKFIDGFDGNDQPKPAHAKSRMYQLGVALRKKYKPGRTV